MRLFGYRPKIGAAGDAMPFCWNGEWHIFFLATPEDVWTVPGRVACRLAHIVSKDLVEWTELPDAFEPGPEGSVDGNGIWTGSLIERDGRFHFFYTGYNHEAIYQQTICRAVSDDLITWTKDPDNPQFKSDETWYEPADWRDPFVYYDDSQDVYTMLIAARVLAGRVDRRGCIAVALSDDLDNWTIEGPLWTPRQAHVMECPEYFELGGYRYLVFSRYSGDARTLYRVATPDGPWEARLLDALDGSKFYAAKSAGDGNQRFTFAWIPQRKHDSNQEEFTWGGQFGSPRELISLPDGTLTCRLPEKIVQSYARAHDFEFTAGAGRWRQDGDTLHCDARGTYGFGHLKTVRADLMLELEIICEPNTMSAGVLLEPEGDMSQGHMLMIEPWRQRVSIRRWPVKWEPWWQNMTVGSPSLGSDMEREALVDQFIPEPPAADSFRVRILRNDQLVECYVNDQVALSYRVYEQVEDMFGLFVDLGAASFNRITIRS